MPNKYLKQFLSLSSRQKKIMVNKIIYTNTPSPYKNLYYKPMICFHLYAKKKKFLSHSELFLYVYNEAYVDLIRCIF